jgi:xanthine dehydrogenase iron-sulfur cluster and FAD-binding subunit A
LSHSPTTLAELVELKHEHKNARIVVGNTELSLEQSLKNMHYPVSCGLMLQGGFASI